MSAGNVFLVQMRQRSASIPYELDPRTIAFKEQPRAAVWTIASRECSRAQEVGNGMTVRKEGT